MRKLTLLVLALTLTACADLQSAIDSAGINTVQPTMNIASLVPLTPWTATPGVSQMASTPVPQFVPEPVNTVVYIYPTPRPVEMPTANATADSLRYQSTALALNILSGQATRAALETDAAMRAGATLTAQPTPTVSQVEQVAGIAAPFMSLVCLVGALIAGSAVSVPLVAFARARADLEQAQANREHYAARVIETPKGSWWVDDDGQPVPLQHVAPPPRFILTNQPPAAAPSAPVTQDTADVLEFLNLCIRHGATADIPSRGTLGMAAGTWQRLKHLLSAARDVSGAPVNWVASSPSGTQFVGGWTCMAARDAIEDGEVVV